MLVVNKLRCKGGFCVTLTFGGLHLTSIPDSKATHPSEVYVSLDLKPFKNRTLWYQ